MNYIGCLVVHDSQLVVHHNSDTIGMVIEHLPHQNKWKVAWSTYDIWYHTDDIERYHGYYLKLKKEVLNGT